MVKRTALAVAEPPPPVALVDRLDFDRVDPSAALANLAVRLHELAGGIDDLGDLSVELTMSVQSASLRFRAVAKRKGL